MTWVTYVTGAYCMVHTRSKATHRTSQLQADSARWFLRTSLPFLHVAALDGHVPFLPLMVDGSRCSRKNGETPNRLLGRAKTVHGRTPALHSGRATRMSYGRRNPVLLQLLQTFTRPRLIQMKVKGQNQENLMIDAIALNVSQIPQVNPPDLPST